MKPPLNHASLHEIKLYSPSGPLGAAAGRFGRVLLVLALGTAVPKTQAAVVLTVLHSFNFTDGDEPNGLVQGSDGNLYGTTMHGGQDGWGTVFKIATNGAFKTLHSFTGGSDGGFPAAGLAQGADGNFYGTTAPYGPEATSPGTVFKITSNGAFTLLHTFDLTNGASPYAALVPGGDGNFYGTTGYGGSYDWGIVFSITPSGAFTNLYSFTGGGDGAIPHGLVQGSDGNFYGTTSYGDLSINNQSGTVFKVGSGGAFTTLYSFTGGSDGVSPNALVQGRDGNFYGTTGGGGTNGGWGTVFRISATGDITFLYSFAGGNDGASPQAGLVQGNDGSFYGTTYAGRASDNGTVFSITPSGAFTKLYSFSGGNAAQYPETNSDGLWPRAVLLQGSDGNLYGTTSGGGPNGFGVVFRLSVGAESVATIVTSGGGFGVQNQQFGFDITGNSGAVAIVQAATDLANPTWITVSTNTLGSGGVSHFSDPLWTNYPGHFYRVRSE